MWSITLNLLVFYCINVVFTKDVAEFYEERDFLLKKEEDMMLGNDIVLSDSEQKANEIIMELKFQELDHAFHHPQMFNMSKHFFDYKDEVKNTQLFKIIQKMPKGAVLHAHDTGLLSPDYVLELTYLPDLYICITEDDVEFLFSKTLPETTCQSEWELLKNARYPPNFTPESVEAFDAKLRTYFTLVIDNPREVYTDVNAAWSFFQKYFIRTSSLFSYIPVWEQYFYDTLKAFREDNIMYIEIRSVLPTLYDLEGNVYDSVATAESYKKVVDQFMVDYPDFFGAKLIYAPMRKVDPATVEEYIKIAKRIKKSLPNFFAGFDLVGQEDLGKPTKEFVPVLLEASKDMDFFFHAGETNWYGTSSDENLVDVILLGTKRIGHAFAISKHPILAEEVKKRGIGLEVNVVSNAILCLVEDLRNHPVASFIAQDLPVVLSSDDPGIWEAEPMSHDFYVTFVGIVSRHADLKLLKKLALNSLYYSSFSEKDKIVHEFELRWQKFIDRVVRDKW